MSEQQETEQQEQPAKKKGGKLPIILVLAAMMFAGGFFGLKMKGGGVKKAPPVELGEIVELPEEFIVNLTDESTYLRSKIALHMVKDFKLDEMAKLQPAVLHEVREALSSLSPAEAGTLEGRKKTQERIAKVLNELLKPKEEHKEEAPKVEEKPEEKAEPQAPAHPDWDSQTGPILKVYFVTWATQ